MILNKNQHILANLKFLPKAFGVPKKRGNTIFDAFSSETSSGKTRKIPKTVKNPTFTNDELDFDTKTQKIVKINGKYR